MIIKKKEGKFVNTVQRVTRNTVQLGLAGKPNAQLGASDNHHVHEMLTLTK